MVNSHTLCRLSYRSSVRISFRSCQNAKKRLLLDILFFRSVLASVFISMTWTQYAWRIAISVTTKSYMWYLLQDAAALLTGCGYIDHQTHHLRCRKGNRTLVRARKAGVICCDQSSPKLNYAPCGARTRDLGLIRPML